MKVGGTHGGLDDLNSNGIVLSNFGPTHDTSTARVAAQFEGFAGLHNSRVPRNIVQSIGSKPELTAVSP